jgi:hypothetical protein
MVEEHENWLAQRGLARLRLARMSETMYSGLIAAALLNASSVRAAVLDALLPDRPELSDADLEYLCAPPRGVDLILLFRSDAMGNAARFVVLVEHKRFGPANFPRLHTYRRRAPDHVTCTHRGDAQRRRASDVPVAGIAQLDAVVCFDDWRDEVTEGVAVAARVFLDAEERDPGSAFRGNLAHPEAWTAVGYRVFGGALRRRYDQEPRDAALRHGLAPLLRGLFA